MKTDLVAGANETPVIICHVGNVPQLPWVLIQAARVMGRERVILLGDDASTSCWPGPTYSVYSYVNTAAEFLSCYEHLSANPREYETFCFMRWFAIAEFMQKHGLDSCFVMDSDMLIYEPLDTMLSFFGSARMGNMTMLNYVRDTNILWDLCTFFVSIYSDSGLLEAVTQRYMQKDAGGNPIPYVADLTLLANFCERRPDVFDMGPLGREGYDFDVASEAGTFRMKDGRKEMTWDDNDVPYYTFRESGERLRVRAAHFLGPSKSHIPRYVDPGIYSR